MPDRVFRWSLNAYLTISVGVLFFLMAVGAMLIVNHYQRLAAVHEAEDKALIILNRNLATHAYFTGELKPSVMKLSESYRSPDYFDPVWMSSTYAVRGIDNIFRGLSAGDYYYKECAVNARSPQNEADPYERAFIEELKRNPDLTSRSEVRMIGGRPQLVVLRRGESMEPACIRCHGDPKNAPGALVSQFGPSRSFQRSVGELVSAISIRVPMSEAYAHARQFSLALSALLIVLFGIAATTLYALNRRLVFRPLVAVRDEARRISARGEGSSEGIPLPAMDELRDLTAAFNAMSADVARRREELEQRVAERTRELSDANRRLEAEIAERHLAEERLVESRKLEAVGRLAGGVAHEFNNMLTVINGYSEMLLSRTNGADPSRRELDAIRTTGQRAAKLTHQLLAFGRKQMMHPEVVETNRVIAGVEKTLRQLLGEKIVLDLRPGEGLWKIRTDPGQLGEIFVNLAMNAKEAMPFGGIFTVESANATVDETLSCVCGKVEPGRYVMVSATDSGVGMDDETVAHIFEPFYTTKPFGEGKGLGLPMIYGTVRQGGGHVTVESSPGKGTTVRLYLPAVS